MLNHLKIINWSAALVIILVVLFYFFVLFSHWVNIPIYDDVDTFETIILFQESNSIFDRAKILLRQHNEHRIVFNRVVNLVLYKIFNQIDFRHMMLIGNLGLVGLTLLLYKNFSVKKDKLILFLPAVFLLFQFNLLKITFWGIAAVEYVWVLLFSYLALFFLFSKKSNIFWASTFGVLATFTFGNGMFVFLVGLLGPFTMRRYKDLAVWLTASTLSLAIYFYNYFKPINSPSITDAILHPIYTLHYFLTSIGHVMMHHSNYFLLLGLIFFSLGYLTIKKYYLKNQAVYTWIIFVINIVILYFSYHKYFAYAWGTLIITAFVFLTFKKYYAKNTTTYSFLVLLFVNAGGLALARSNGTFHPSMPDTYALYSIMFFVLTYISIIEYIQSKQYYNKNKLIKNFSVSHPIFIALLFFSIFTYMNSYWLRIPTIKSEYKSQVERFRDDFLELPSWWFDGIKEKTVQDAIDQGIYVIPE